MPDTPLFLRFSREITLDSLPAIGNNDASPVTHEISLLPLTRNVAVGCSLAHGSTKNPAFSLVELLVVVAIIAILAAVAVPVVSGMLDRGADAADMSNLRQIGTAICQYAAENGVVRIEKRPAAGHGA